MSEGTKERPDWKAAVRTLCEMHQTYGAGNVNLIGECALVPGLETVNSTPDEELYSEAGSTLSPKKVRGWLWTQRKSRRIQRRQAILWSVYHEEDGTSYAGVGTLMSPVAVERVS